MDGQQAGSGLVRRAVADSAGLTGCSNSLSRFRATDPPAVADSKRAYLGSQVSCQSGRPLVQSSERPGRRGFACSTPGFLPLQRKTHQRARIEVLRLSHRGAWSTAESSHSPIVGLRALLICDGVLSDGRQGEHLVVQHFGAKKAVGRYLLSSLKSAIGCTR